MKKITDLIFIGKNYKTHENPQYKTTKQRKTLENLKMMRML